MADSYSTRLGQILMETGSHSNEWGTLANLNFQRLDAAIRGYINVNIATSTSVTLDSNDITTTGSTAEENSFFKFIEITGTPASGVTITVPAENIMWYVRNNCGQTITWTPSGGTGATVVDGQTAIFVYGANGTTMTNVTAELWGNGIEALTTAEVNQLENIGSSTVSAAQWGYLGGMDQALATTDGVTFTTITGTVVTTNTGLVPDANDGAYLGQSGTAFSDLFLASGAVINFNAGDVTLTHSANTLTVAGGTLAAAAITGTTIDASTDFTVGGTVITDNTITDDGTLIINATTAVSFSDKNITNVGDIALDSITADDASSFSFGSNWTAASRTCADLGTVTTVDINGGTIDGATIGGAAAGAITGTTITANTGLVPDANDGAYLGQSGTAFSDLFLASGAVINFNAGDVTLTHSSDTLTLGGGNLAMADNELQRPEIKDYAIIHTTPSISSGAVTFDCANGNSFAVSLTENITSITLSNPPASGNYGEIVIEFTQDATGSRTVAGWPASVDWPGGTAPTITTTATTGRDKVFLSTRDGGTTWLGEYSQDYS